MNNLKDQTLHHVRT